MPHSDPAIEVWESLKSDWGPVADYCEDRIRNCLWRLAAKDTTTDISDVRTLQAEIGVLKEMLALPTLKLSQVSKPAKRNKEA